MNIKLWAYDVEVLPNFFSVTFIDINSYLKEFYNACNINIKKGKTIREPIPLVQKYTVKEIKEKLDKVICKQFYITDTDDSQLVELAGFINSMRNKQYITHCYGYNTMKYDKLMIAGFLSKFRMCNTTKELITYLHNLSHKIIDSQNDNSYQNNDYELKMLREYGLPYKDIDLMRIFALNKCGKGVNANGETIFFSKGLKQTSINLQWYELLEYELPPISELDIDLYSKHYTYKKMKESCSSVEEICKSLNNIINKWDRNIINEWIPNMMYYNKNDVFICCEMVRLYMDEIKLRYNISNSYEIDVLNSSRSNIADRLFKKFYSEFSGLAPWQWKGHSTQRTTMAFKRIILPFIEFKTQPLKELLNEMKSTVVTSIGKDAFKKEIKIGNLIYTVATGGLHSQDIPRELKSKLKYINEDLKNENNIWENLTDDSFIYIHWDISDAVPHKIVL